MTPDCARAEAVVDEVVAGASWPDDLKGHVDGCAECQARVAFARRVEQVLATWPTAAAPAEFAARVAAAARREAWTQEVVVDWGFNLALAGCLALILSGVAGVVWAVSYATPTGDATRVAVDLLTDVMARARAQASIAITALGLLVTTFGGWWWAEQRDW